MRACLLVVLFVGVPAFVGCGGDSAGGGDMDAVVGVIGPDGGELAIENGLLAGTVLSVSAGALDRDVEITMFPTVDGTPLVALADRIGPQIGFEPDGLPLRDGATLTVPFDIGIVEAYGQTPADCKVWKRTSDGWERLEQTAATEGTVTVAIDTLATAAAGIGIAPRTTSSCDIAPSLCNITVPVNCTANDACIERIANAPVPLDPRSMSVFGNKVYYAIGPAVGSVSVAEVDVDSHETTQFRALPNVRGTIVGAPAVDASGNAWLTIVGLGNVKFSKTSAPVIFDTAKRATLGGVVSVGGEVQRYEAPVAFSTRGEVQICGIEPSRGCYSVLSERGFQVVRRVLPRRGAPAGTKSLLAVGTVDVAQATVGGGRETFKTILPVDLPASEAATSAGGPLVAPSETDATYAVQRFRRVASNVPLTKVMYTVTDQDRGIARPPCEDDASIGALALDADRRIMATETQSPELISCTPQGGKSYVRLTDADAGTTEFNRLIPVGIVYVPDGDRFIVLTRGSTSPELYEVVPND